VTRVLAAIREADDLRMSIEDAAAMVFLSPSRFAHLFKQQVGLPEFFEIPSPFELSAAPQPRG